MKNSNFLLPAAGFVVAIGCALAPRPELPAPFYGIDPDTGTCELGTLQGTCGGTSSTRCTVLVGKSIVSGFDSKVGTTCTTPVFRPTGTEPPPIDPNTPIH
jgi:hypothetical protein